MRILNILILGSMTGSAPAKNPVDVLIHIRKRAAVQVHSYQSDAQTGQMALPIATDRAECSLLIGSVTGVFKLRENPGMEMWRIKPLFGYEVTTGWRNTPDYRPKGQKS